jgi:formylglycine-generating enzyme required for sulfatase activity
MYRPIAFLATVVLFVAALISVTLTTLTADDATQNGAAQKGEAAVKTEPLPVNKDAEAKSESEMKAYSEKMHASDIKFDMVPIKGGKFTIGSPESEKEHGKDEGPQTEVTVKPFWMGKCEVTWDEYDLFLASLDCTIRKELKLTPTPEDLRADAIARPTNPYTDMTFGMGKRGFPAISMTHYAARIYCKWLSTKTGHYYRLPTEVEWEYACRAGTKTAYSFGDDPAKLDEYAWFEDNSAIESDPKYSKVGKKKPNPWGLHDMHGNVCEWCLDQYIEDQYKNLPSDKSGNPVVVTTKLYKHVTRGGGFSHAAKLLRSAARLPSEEDWKDQDPQEPKSVWYHTDAQFSGFRVVRPLVEPSEEEKKKIWDAGLDIESDGARTQRPCLGEVQKKAE